MRAPSPADSSDFFEEDDEETLRNIVGNGCIDERLTLFSQRFGEDHVKDSHNLRWRLWMSEVENDGFVFTESYSSTHPGTERPSASYPPAFDSEDGRNHLRATASVLDVSEERAVHLTMSSFRSNDDATNLHDLLGTRSLLTQVVDYYFRQRTARISSIAELLLREQGMGVSPGGAIDRVLRSLDSHCIINGKRRGLFKYLATIAFQAEEDQSPSPEQLKNVNFLRREVSGFCLQTLRRPQNDKRWHRFGTILWNSMRSRRFQERETAVRALTVLLYNRIQDGVQRIDYMILLHALKSSQNLCVAKKGSKFSQLAGLVCVECASLWRLIDAKGGMEWISCHPMLIGLFPSTSSRETATSAVTEFEAIKAFLLERARERSGRNPESLALMSFGLLQSLAHQCILESQFGHDDIGYWHTFREQGQVFVQTSSDLFFALDHLHATMESLVSSPVSRCAERRQRLSYDWLLFGKEMSTTTERGGCEIAEICDMDGESIICASIGHELLSALCLILGDDLSSDCPADCQNLALVCDLTTVIYQNSPTLCEPFWKSQQPTALSRFLDLASSLVWEGGRAEEVYDAVMIKEAVLAKVAPFLQLMSSFCYSSEQVEFAFGVITRSLLQRVLRICAFDVEDVNTEKGRTKFRILSSLSTLASVGNTGACRELIRGAVGGVAGPGLLLNALSPSDARVAEVVLSAASRLTKDAPVAWSVAMAASVAKLSALDVDVESKATFHLTQIHYELAISMPRVVFSQAVSDTEGDHFMRSVWGGVQRLSLLPAAALSNVSRESPALETVASTLDLFSTLLESLRAVISLHESACLRASAQSIRMAMLHMLATSGNFAEAVIYHALFPHIWSLAIALEGNAQERRIMQTPPFQGSMHAGTYGLLHGAANTAGDSETVVKEFVLSAPNDMEGIIEKTGVSFDIMISVILTALGLIRSWALNAEGAITGLDTDEKIRKRLVTLTPWKLLSQITALPNPFRTNGRVKSSWGAIRPTNFQLLIRYFDFRVDGNNWPHPVSAITLDILHAVLSHAHTLLPCAHPEDAPLTGTLQGPSIFEQIFEVLAPLSEGSHGSSSGDEKIAKIEREKKILMVLALRLLSVSVFALPTAPESSQVGGKVMRSVFRGLGSACANLNAFRSTNRRLSWANQCLLDDLHVALACLCFLRAAWSNAHHLFEVIDQYEEASAAFSTMAKLLLDQACTEAPAPDDCTARSCFFSFLADVVDFLRLALDHSLSCRKSGVSGLMGVYEENALRLLSMPKNFMSVFSCCDVAQAKKAFCLFANSTLPQKIALSNTECLLQLVPLTASSKSFNVDTLATARTLSTLACGRAQSDDKRVLALVMSCHAIWGEACLLKQWSKFADLLLRMSRDSSKPDTNGRGCTAPTTREDRKNSYLLCGIEALRVLKENTANISAAQMDGAGLKLQDVGKMAVAIAGLVTKLIVEGTETLKPLKFGTLAVDVLGLLSACASKFFPLLESDPGLCCLLERHLFTSVVAILNSIEESVVSDLHVSAINEIGSPLVLTINRIFDLLEFNVTWQSCSETCIVTLTLLASMYDGCGGIDSLARYLKEQGLLDRLVFHASSVFPSSMFLSDEYSIDLLESFSEFIMTLSEANCSEVLEVLDTSGALKVLARNAVQMPNKLWSSGPLTSAQERFGRQNRSMKGSSTLVGDKADPRSMLWQKTLRIFKNVLRSARQTHLPSLEKRERLHSLVADFVAMNHEFIRGCMKTTELKLFTKDGLQEAMACLSLLSELSSRPFDGRTIKLMHDFIPVSIQLLARFGALLGASSASRELFGFDDNDAVEVAMRHSPCRHGHNAHHEAIRFSHYASRCCTPLPLSREEITSSNIQEGGYDRSATALEEHGKSLMSSEFVMMMEDCVGLACFAALSLLWELHPVNSSFCVFSQLQSSKIDAKQLVRPGMVIAFSSDQTSQRARGTELLPHTHYAQVIRSNSHELSFHVRDLESGDTQVVRVGEVVGIEDANKRYCLLGYGPAPESASELESTQAVSVGHLILILRWCASKPSAIPVAKRLAGLSSSILAAELSIHKEIGSPLNCKPEISQHLFAQLLDLFGTAPGVAAWGKTGGAGGRLKKCLDAMSWICLKKSMRDELLKAGEYESKLRAESDMAVDDSIFLRGSGRNPFQDLRMSY